MSKRTIDDQFKAPRKVWPDTQEENLTKRWDMEHVITRLDDIQDSIDQILAMLSREQQLSESEDTSSGRL